MNKITTTDEYKNALEKKKEYRDMLFNLRIELFMSKNDSIAIRLVEEKIKLVKKELGKVITKIREYEIYNNIEIKKEGKRK